LLSKIGYDADVVADGYEAAKSILGLSFNHLSPDDAIKALQENQDDIRSKIRSCNDPHGYDVILMDLQMPNLDGFGAVEMIRVARQGRCMGKADTPLIKGYNPSNASCPWIIALTANAMNGDSQRCLESGFNAYLSKPLRLPALVNALKKAYEVLQNRVHT